MHPSPNPSPNQAYSQMDDDLHVEVSPEEVAPVFPSYHPLPSYRLRRWAHGPRLCPLVITPVPCYLLQVAALSRRMDKSDQERGKF